MIVSEKQAEAAWVVLSRHHDPENIGIHNANNDDVTALFRNESRWCHPDTEHGTIEKWAELDRAKHIMLNWIRRQADKPPPRIAPEPCNNCDGQGYLTSARGFRKPMRVQCGKCRGTGEAGVEHDLGGE